MHVAKILLLKTSECILANLICVCKGIDPLDCFSFVYQFLSISPSNKKNVRVIFDIKSYSKVSLQLRDMRGKQLRWSISNIETKKNCELKGLRRVASLGEKSLLTSSITRNEYSRIIKLASTWLNKDWFISKLDMSLIQIFFSLNLTQFKFTNNVVKLVY